MKTFNPNDFTILIVDDIKQNIQVLTTILEYEGYSIGFSLSGKEALETIHYTQFDLIILDYLMPEMNGVEVCQKIKNNPNYVNIPIIFITASHDEKVLLEAFAVGAVDYISKPFKPLELLARIENHLKFKQAKEEAEKAATIKAQFLATMSHEIRTPLQSILGVTELLMQTNFNAEQLSLLKILQSSGEHLLLIVNDIIDFSDLENNQIKLKIGEFNLTLILDELLNLVSFQTSEKNLDINYFISPNIPNNLIGDSLRTRQILLNIINNAIKFTDSGEIIINVEIAENKNQNNNKIILKFSVKDTGIGIDINQQKQLFQSFTQLDISHTRKYGGTGLGLAICQQLIKIMGGEINVESEVNKGSTFWFSIPLELPPNISHEFYPQLPHINAFILDNNNHNREFIKLYLNQFKMQVNDTDKSRDFIRQIATNDFKDTFLNFINIDDQNLELNKIISLLQLQDTSQIILIGFEEKNSAIEKFRGINISNFYYLKKPLTKDKLHQCINDLIISVNQNNIELIDNNNFPQKEAIKTQDNQDNQQPKILLVEDNRVNQKVILLQLKKIGYQAEVVNNGQECLDKLTQQNYDILLMDCQMPVLDGYETTQIIRQQKTFNNSIIIIGLTANVIEGEKEKCLQIGMNDYISKPVSIDMLKETLNKWINLINN